MNLDNLKTEWDNNQTSYSTDEVQSIFEIKTKRQVSHINRVMLIDNALMILVATALIIFTFFVGLESRFLVTLEIITSTLIMLIHYKIKHRLLNKDTFFNEDIFSGMAKLSSRLKAYLLAYRIIIPLFIGLTYLKMQWDIMIARQLKSGDFILEFLIALPLVVMSYFIVKWLSNKMYGKQLNELQKLRIQLSRLD